MGGVVTFTHDIISRRTYYKKRWQALKAKEITLTAIFTSLTIVGAQIYIPIGEVPITLQVLFVLMSGLILKEKLGFMSQITYVLMGAIGLPVFAGFKGGFTHIIGPTGGYIIAFPLSAWIVGKVSRKSGFKRYVLASFVGIMVIYMLGTSWLGIYLKSAKTAILLGMIPFILWDVLKALIASYIAYKYESYFKNDLQKIF